MRKRVRAEYAICKNYVYDATNRMVKGTNESGVGGLTYRYVYGLEKIETVIYGIPNGAGSVMQQYEYPNSTENIVKLYYHQDRLGSTDFLTDNIVGKVTSYVTYDDWGMLTAKAVLKVGVRELDLVQEYTGHAWDMVLGVYFAQARMYDAADRRFMAMDWVKGYAISPQSIAVYTYVSNNPLIWIDVRGTTQLEINGYRINDSCIKIGSDSQIMVLVIPLMNAVDITVNVERNNWTDSYDAQLLGWINKSTSLMFNVYFWWNSDHFMADTFVYDLNGRYIEDATPGTVLSDGFISLDYFERLMCLYGKQFDIKNKPFIVTKAHLLDLRWNKVTDNMVRDLNRVQMKYEITTVERVRHFLAQCMDETGSGQNIREGEYLLDNGSWNQAQYEAYYNNNTTYKYKYRGVGYIQTTNAYNYLSFATAMIAEAYPDLDITVRYPVNTDEPTLRTYYDRAVNAAKSKGYDIKQYTDIVDLGADYVAKDYAWEIAGFWWKSGNVNTVVDGLKPGDASEVDKVTAIVNKYAPWQSYSRRRTYYTETTNVII